MDPYTKEDQSALRALGQSEMFDPRADAPDKAQLVLAEAGAGREAEEAVPVANLISQLRNWRKAARKAVKAREEREALRSKPDIYRSARKVDGAARRRGRTADRLARDRELLDVMLAQAVLYGLKSDEP